jgi:C4-type Zn-finger protein
MAFTCEHCGYKTNEAKGGGAISEKGKRLTLRVEGAEDFTRDVLKVYAYLSLAQESFAPNSTPIFSM